jgi:hypothetical protein
MLLFYGYFLTYMARYGLMREAKAKQDSIVDLMFMFPNALRMIYDL